MEGGHPPEDELEPDEELELDEDEPEEDELDEEELDELLDEELLEEEEEEEDEPPPLGAEHSFTPPATRVPAPKVASLQTKLPLRVLKVNLSERPKATLVGTGTEQVLFSLQIVT